MCVTVILFQTNIPESRQNNALSINQLERNVHVVNVGRARRFIFLLPSSRASRKMPRSPRLAHKAPVMQATLIKT